MIKYEINKKNSKKVVIIQHGAFVNNDSMKYLLKEFKNENYTTIITELPNHRKIDTIEVDSIYDMSNIMRELIRTLKLTNKIDRDSEITYVGWSMGGSIGLDIACKQESKEEKLIDKLVLLDSSYTWGDFPQLPKEGFPEIFKGMFQASFNQKLSKEEIEGFMSNYYRMLAPSETAMNDITALREFDVEDKLKEIKIPVLIMSGENDGVATVEWQNEMHRQIENSRLYIVKDEGHCLPLDNSKFVSDKIKDFIS